MADVAHNTSTTAIFEAVDNTAVLWGTYSGSFETDGDIDWIAVPMNSGLAYSFRSSSNGPFGTSGTSLTLYNADGVALANGLNGVSYTPATSGVYYIAVEGNVFAQGEYAISFSTAALPDVLFSFGDQTVSWAGANHLRGQDGNDTLTLTGSGGASGEQGNDRLTGSAAANELFGGYGNDIIDGGEGFDLILGGDGDDQLDGGTFSDRIYGGAGNDHIWAGPGGGDGLYGGDGNDIIETDTAFVAMNGGDGNDVYVVRTSATTSLSPLLSELFGSGIDTVQSTVSFNLSNAAQAAGAVENLTLIGTAAINGTGNALANTITGNAAGNVLSALAGNDRLYGGAGRDTLIGGAGNDRFGYRTVAESRGTATDVVRDFDDSGNDVIDLGSVYGGRLAFIGSAGFTRAGQVHIRDLPGADVLVEVNIGGSLAADMTIRLAGTSLVSMTASDFVL